MAFAADGSHMHSKPAVESHELSGAGQARPNDLLFVDPPLLHVAKNQFLWRVVPDFFSRELEQRCFHDPGVVAEGTSEGSCSGSVILKHSILVEYVA